MLREKKQGAYDFHIKCNIRLGRKGRHAKAEGRHA